jgi:hypothetical protein
VLLALALAGIVRLFWSWSGRQGRVKVVAVVASAGLLLVALLALTPVTVNVTGGATPVTAVCGFDTYLAGNPDRSVERECRAHYTSRVELAAALGVAAMVVAAAGLVAGRRRADGPPGPRAVVVA